MPVSQGAASNFVAPGDDLGFSQLHARLTRAVAASSPTWLSDRTDDIVQSAMLRVIKIVKRNEGKSGFTSSYLWKVAYSALVDEIRRHRSRREVEFSEEVVQGQLGHSTFPNPERQAGASEAGELLRDCMTQMLQTRRSAVTAYLQGHTIPETARLLGWTAKRAENLVYRGLSDLRRCLQMKGVRP